VEVTYGEKFARIAPRVDVVERKQEKYFRRYRETRRYSRNLAFARWPSVEWASELLVPEVDNFSVESLVRGLVTASLERAGVEGVERVVVQINRLRVRDHAIAVVSGLNSSVTGALIAYDAAGQIVGQADLTAIMTTDFQAAARYEDSDFAFPETARHQRVGPTLSYFVHKALGEAFPGREFARPVSITF